MSSRVADEARAQAKNDDNDAGVGIIFAEGLDNANSKAVSVMTLVRGGPAERDATIKVGDVIEEVEGKSVIGKSIEEIRGLVLGMPGTVVDLGFRRKGSHSIMQVTLPRERDWSEELGFRLLQTERELDSSVNESKTLHDELEHTISQREQLEVRVRNLSEELHQEKAARALAEARVAELESKAVDGARLADVERALKEAEAGKRELRERNGALERELVRVQNSLSAATAKPGPAPAPAPAPAQQPRAVASQPAAAPAVTLQPKVVTYSAPSSPHVSQRGNVNSSVQGSPVMAAASGPAVGEEPEMGGVGIILQDDPTMTAFPVETMSANGSAAQSGMIRLGDKLIGVDVYSVQDRPLSLVKEFVRGPVGTTVTLHFQRASSRPGVFEQNMNQEVEVYQVTLTRSREPGVARQYSATGPNFGGISAPVSAQRSPVQQTSATVIGAGHGPLDNMSTTYGAYSVQQNINRPSYVSLANGGGHATAIGSRTIGYDGGIPARTDSVPLRGNYNTGNVGNPYDTYGSRTPALGAGASSAMGYAQYNAGAFAGRSATAAPVQQFGMTATGGNYQGSYSASPSLRGGGGYDTGMYGTGGAYGAPTNNLNATYSAQSSPRRYGGAGANTNFSSYAAGPSASVPANRNDGNMWNA